MRPAPEPGWGYPPLSRRQICRKRVLPGEHERPFAPDLARSEL